MLSFTKALAIGFGVTFFTSITNVVYAGTVKPISNPIAGEGGTVEPINVNERNVGPIQKRFSSPGLFGPRFLPIDIVFDVQNSGNVERFFFSETVTNHTDVNWFDFHFSLGFGTGENFRLSGNNDFLDFGTGLPNPPSPKPKSNKFKSSKFESNGNKLSFFDGEVLPSIFRDETVSFSFAIDIPDNLPNNQFTLRQIPSVSTPEPTSTLSLLALGTLGAASTLKRKFKPSQSTLRKLEKVS